MVDYCTRCGCKLDLTTYGRKFCKNCGILPENQDFPEENGEEKERSYYG